MNATDTTTLRAIETGRVHELVGKVRTVRFWDQDSCAIIAVLADGTGVKGETEGEPLEAGETYRFFGRHVDHQRWGRQFAFDTYTIDTPHDRRGVLKYLASEARNVGKAIAERLWDTYGSQCIEVLRTNPQRVATDGLLSFAEAQEAAADLIAIEKYERTRIDLATLFAGRGFPRSTVKACIAAWGVRAAQVVQRDPLTMLVRSMPGAGFKRCDRLYLDLRGDHKRIKRQMLAGWAALRDGVDGNTWHPQGAFNMAIVKAVGNADAEFERAVTLGVRARWLRVRTDEQHKLWFAEAEKARSESELALKVKRLLNAQADMWPTLETPDVSEHQAAAVNEYSRSPVLIIAGTPGTGKTYVAAALVRAVLPEIGAAAVAVCAPTGKAAVRITEAMERYKLPLKATTIHSLLRIGRNGHDGRGWGFEHGEDKPLPHRLIVIDEGSMLDTDLAADLFRAIQPGTRVLIVGDPYQLPPVGHGAPLRDLIAAGVPCATLTEIQRNSGAIVRACAAMKDGARFQTCPTIDEAAGQNLRLIECADEAAQVHALTQVFAAVCASGKRHPVWDTQVITPLNEKSGVSRVPLNKYLQGMLNPVVEGNNDVCVGEFRRADKVICLRNCLLDAVELATGGVRSNVAGYRDALDASWQKYRTYLANGDLGRVEAVDPDARVIVATFFAPDRLVRIPIGKAGTYESSGGDGSAQDFGLAYAITIHKSQGSEWPLVIVMIDEAAGQIACRELIYTAISRASKVCLLIGRRAVVDRQVGKVSLVKRKTFLRELLTTG